MTKSSVPSPARQLIELIQLLNFGRIENLNVRQGSPEFEPPPRVIKMLKLGGQDGSREEATLTDFQLKQPVVDLLRTMNEIGDGRILVIEVRHGLPITVEVEVPAKAL